MKVNMSNWEAEWHTEAGFFTAIVTGSGEAETSPRDGSAPKRYLYIAFDIADKKYLQRYYLKNGMNRFFTADCIKIMGGSERVLADDFDTDEMNGIKVDITLDVWGNSASLQITNIQRTTRIPNNHLAPMPNSNSNVPF